MKKDFWDYMLKVMDENPDVYIISAGLGWPRTDEFAKKYKERFIQTEASEQTAADICVGLSYSGKIPVMYTITPFYLRCWETIRTYINHEKLKVIMIGAGRNDDYSKHDGFSHEAGDISEHMDLMKNIKQFYPNTKPELEYAINDAIGGKNPTFISVRK